MANAKRELIKILVSSGAKIKCAKITYGDEMFDSDVRTFCLPLLAQDTEVEAFFNSLDFDYDSGYGGQNLFGTVWLEKEGTWLSRGEYDGSEWWEYNECPEIPIQLY